MMWYSTTRKWISRKSQNKYSSDPGGPGSDMIILVNIAMALVKRKKDCATSGLATNKIAVRNEKKGKAKAALKAVGSQKIGKKKKAATGKGTPAPTYNDVRPRLCIGLFVCVDNNGSRSLGTVISYDSQTKLFKIEFDDERKEFMDLKDVLKNMARAPDIMEAQQALKAQMQAEKMNAEKIALEQEKEHAAAEEAST
ncbi:hypothetical protein VNO77_16493 [Canavalia gladiata]|uniref:Uncharacterized protein n=1 Tax=Canavalia gladiata TaxID=3824 RepID=A0AAN9M0H4_CANGL